VSHEQTLSLLKTESLEARSYSICQFTQCPVDEQTSTNGKLPGCRFPAQSDARRRCRNPAAMPRTVLSRHKVLRQAFPGAFVIG
jgi:hypothetical protein